MPLIGYARASTEDQNLAPQLDALRAAGCGEVFEEFASGASRSRPQLAAALARVRRGDTLMWRASTASPAHFPTCSQWSKPCAPKARISVRSPIRSTHRDPAACSSCRCSGRWRMMRSPRLCGVVSSYPRCELGFGDLTLRIIPDIMAVRRYGGAEATGSDVPGLKREAIRASGALNWPRRKAGGSTASTASSFSDGSSRR